MSHVVCEGSEHFNSLAIGCNSYNNNILYYFCTI